MIIPGSWIFSLIVLTPPLIGLHVEDNACVWMFEEWMPKAYFLFWSAVVIVAMAIMVGLYSRIVFTLWFKRDTDNQLTFHQRVSIKGVEYGDTFILVNLRKWAGKKFQIISYSLILRFLEKWD